MTPPFSPRALVFWATALAGGSAAAEVRRVPEDHVTIQEAIEASHSGDLVSIAAREEPYVEALHISSAAGLDTLTLESRASVDPAAIVAPAGARAVVEVDAEMRGISLTLRGLDLRNHNPRINPPGRIDGEAAAELCLYGLRIRTSRSADAEQALYTCALRMEDSRISSSDFGIGIGWWRRIYFDQVDAPQAKLEVTLRGNTIEGLSDDDNDGIALWGAASGEISGNIVEGFGEGVHTSAAGHAPAGLSVHNNVFFHGRSSAFHVAHHAGLVVVSNNIFSGPRACSEIDLSALDSLDSLEAPRWICPPRPFSDGLTCTGADTLVVTNNLFVANHGDALRIERARYPGVTVLAVHGNIFYKNNPLHLDKYDILIERDGFWNHRLKVDLGHNSFWGNRGNQRICNAPELIRASNQLRDPGFHGCWTPGDTLLVDAGWPHPELNDCDQSRNDIGIYGGPRGGWSPAWCE